MTKHGNGSRIGKFVKKKEPAQLVEFKADDFECPNCRQFITHPFVISCRHLLCVMCAYDLVRDHSPNCPKCYEKFSQLRIWVDRSV